MNLQEIFVITILKRLLIKLRYPMVNVFWTMDTAYNRLEVNKEEYDMAYNEANQLMKKLENNKNKLEEFTNRYLKEFQDK